MTDSAIRVLVVDDNVTFRQIVSNILSEISGVEVVGTAPNGKIALEKITQFRPDLLTLDVEMPVMGGLEVLRHLHHFEGSIDALMISSFTEEGTKATIQALAFGAFDFAPKPTGTNYQENLAEFRRRIRFEISAYTRAREVRELLHLRTDQRPDAETKTSKVYARRPDRSLTRKRGNETPQIIVVGISTGGSEALSKMLPELPKNLPVPMLIVQHMPERFTKSLSEHLNELCAIEVEEAIDGQIPKPGHVFLAPGGKQMKMENVEGIHVIRITDDPPENSCRPSVDFLFRSAAKLYGADALGIIMTGMGNDGTIGCRLLKERGATIIAQDERSCVVYGMPMHPIEEGIVDQVVPLDRMAEEISYQLHNRTIYYQPNEYVPEIE